jgi:hypothetical protein
MTLFWFLNVYNAYISFSAYPAGSPFLIGNANTPPGKVVAKSLRVGPALIHQKSHQEH